jgi:hypothetical protein
VSLAFVFNRQLILSHKTTVLTRFDSQVIMVPAVNSSIFEQITEKSRCQNTAQRNRITRCVNINYVMLIKSEMNEPVFIFSGISDTTQE